VLEWETVKSDRIEGVMDSKQVALLLLAKMALADGNIDQEEREMLLDIVQDPLVLNDLIAQAKSCHLDELIGQLDNYADKFFVALRAFMIAHVDEHFDVEEERLFRQLVSKLEITPEDIELIELVAEFSADPTKHALPTRLEQLYLQSSFAMTSLLSHTFCFLASLCLLVIPSVFCFTPSMVMVWDMFLDCFILLGKRECCWNRFTSNAICNF
jgi:tellurite resistance protein